MHIQPLFLPCSTAALHAMIRRYPLGTLITRQEGDILSADLMPMALDLAPDTLGVVRGHVARGNPVARGVGGEAMIVFQSPNHYIRPRWYVNGQASRRNAPSWNYAAVQVRGRLRIVDDADWLMRHLDALTQAQESAFEDGWGLDDADPGVLADAARRLVGWELEISHLEGKEFLSQQRTPADRASIVAQLRQQPPGAAHEVAALIQDKG